MRSAGLILSVLAPLSFALAAGAQPPHREGASDEAMSLARQRAEEYSAAFNRADAQALADLYAPDADRVFAADRRAGGREEIEGAYRQFFAENGGAELQITVDHARLLRPDVLLVEGSWTMTDAGEGRPTAGRSTVVATEEGGRWRLTYVLTYASAEAPGQP